MIAVDPLLESIDGMAVLIVALKVLVAFVGLLVAVMLMIWFERKLHADMSNRVGPNVAGPFGLFQTLADGIKAFFKEDIIPNAADRFVFRLAPFLSIVPAFLTFAIIPLGGQFGDDRSGVVTILGHATLLQVADPQVGILFMLAMSAIAVYGVMLAGWGSGSKYPLLGSVRASAQMVSYEAALGLSLLAVLIRSRALSTNAIVASQADWNWNLWMTGLVPFIIFLIAGTAEMNRPPFDLVEAEQELVGGFNTEYSGIRFALFYLSEFMNVITMSAILVTLFLGGPAGPSFGATGWVADYLIGFGWFFVKLLALLCVFVLFRTVLPRLRYDQLMDLGWKVLIPVATVFFLGFTTFQLAYHEHWNWGITIPIVVVTLAVVTSVFRLSLKVAQRRRIEEELSY